MLTLAAPLASIDLVEEPDSAIFRREIGGTAFFPDFEGEDRLIATQTRDAPGFDLLVRVEAFHHVAGPVDGVFGLYLVLCAAPCLSRVVAVGPNCWEQARGDDDGEVGDMHVGLMSSEEQAEIM